MSSSNSDENTCQTCLTETDAGGVEEFDNKSSVLLGATHNVNTCANTIHKLELKEDEIKETKKDTGVTTDTENQTEKYVMSETKLNAESNTKTTAVDETQRENTNSAAKYVLNKEAVSNKRNVIEQENQELKFDANLGKGDPPNFESKHDLSVDYKEKTFHETEHDIENCIKGDQSRKLELENPEEDRAKQNTVCETKFDDLNRTNVEDTNNTINFDNVDRTNADALLETGLEFHIKELQSNETLVPEGKITEPDGKKANNETNKMASDKEAEKDLLTENLQHRETAILDHTGNIPESGEEIETFETKSNFNSEQNPDDLRETNSIYIPNQNGDEESEENEKVTAKQDLAAKASNGRKSTKEPDTFLKTDSNGESEMNECATYEVPYELHTETKHNDSPKDSNTDTKACGLCETETTDETLNFFLFNESSDLIEDDKQTEFLMEGLDSDSDSGTQRKTFHSDATETDIVTQHGTSDAVVANSNESSTQVGETQFLLSCIRGRQWADKGNTEILTVNNIGAEKHGKYEGAHLIHVSSPISASNITCIPFTVFDSEDDGNSTGEKNSMRSPDNFEDNVIKDDPDSVLVDHQRRNAGQTDKDFKGSIDRPASETVHGQDQQSLLIPLTDDEFQTKNDSLPETIANDLEQRVEDLERQCQDKDEELDRLRTELQSCERMYAEQSSELARLKSEQQSFERMYLEKSTELDELRTTHQSYELMYKEHSKNSEHIRTDNETLKDKNAHLSAAVQELRKEIDRVHAELGSYQKHTEDYERIKAELNDVRQSLIPGKDAESAMLTSSVQQLTDLNDHQQEKIQSLEAALADFEKLREFLQSRENELAFLQTAYLTMEVHSKTLYEEYGRLNDVVVPEKDQQIDSVTQENTRLQRELQSVKDEIVSLRKEKSTLEVGFKYTEEHGRMKETVIQEKSRLIESVAQENLLLQAELQNRADTIETLHREKSHYMQQCKAMNDQLRNLNKMVKEKEGNIISLWQQIAAIQKKYDDMMRSVRSLESLPASPLYNALVVLQKFYYREFGTKTSITPESVQHLHTLVEAARSELRTISDIEEKVAEAIVAHINMIEENSRLHELVGEQVIETGQLKNQIELLKGKVSSLERKLRRNPRTEE